MVQRCGGRSSRAKDRLVQRSVRPEPNLLSRARDGLLFFIGGEIASQGFAGAARTGLGQPWRNVLVRLCPRESNAVPEDLAAARADQCGPSPAGAPSRRMPISVPSDWERLPAPERPRIRREAQGHFRAPAAEVSPGTAAGSHVSNGRTRRPDDHGLGESGPGRVALLLIQRTLPRLRRRKNCAARREVDAGSVTKPSVVGPQFFAEFPGLAEKAVYVSDGAMDVTGAVELYVNSLARSIAPVRLTGNYGSEVLRGNVAFRPGAVNPELLTPEFSRLVAAASTNLCSRAPGPRPVVHSLQAGALASLFAPRSRELAGDDAITVPRQRPGRSGLPGAGRAGPQPRPGATAYRGRERAARRDTDRPGSCCIVASPWRQRFRSSFRSSRSRPSMPMTTACQHWLTRLDRAAVSVASRATVPRAAQVLSLPRLVSERITRLPQDILLDARARSRPYINGRFLARMVDDHIEGKRNYTSELHRVLTAELLQRQLLEDGKRPWLADSGRLTSAA